MKLMWLVSLAVVALCSQYCSANIFGRTQSVKVTGQFFCQQDPSKAVGVKVYLMDEDDGGPDDLMGETETDEEGRFTIGGKEKELTSIDPELKVYHDCNDRDATGLIKDMPCQRKWKLTIPDLYIDGKNSTAVMDIGRINLEIKMPGEEHDCIH